MEINFHGDRLNSLSIEVGDMLRFVDVTGKIRQGLLVRIEQLEFPRQGIVHLHMLEDGVMSKMDTNRIFKCRKL